MFQVTINAKVYFLKLEKQYTFMKNENFFILLAYLKMKCNTVKKEVIKIHLNRHFPFFIVIAFPKIL